MQPCSWPPSGFRSLLFGRLAVHSSPVSEVARILDSIAQGDPKAAEELLPLVYDELRKLATHKMASQPPGQTLQPTALVHEAWLRLVGKEAARFADRTHFLCRRRRRRRSARQRSGRRRFQRQCVEPASNRLV
jgi:hypothetical protein